MPTTPRQVIDSVVRSVCGHGADRLVRLTSGGMNETYRVELSAGGSVIVRIARIDWHLFRHGFAQHALRKGADIGTVQEMLGHTSNVMTRRYAGQVRQIEAARRMPRYAPI